MEISLRKVIQEDWDFILKLRNENEFKKYFQNQKYIENNGDTYNEFLSKPIKVKMLEDVEYDWMVEGCEDEYQDYPIKFKLKYS